ncbi:Hsp20/alpha crystallin family protein [Sulfolobus sp. S-194]|nr:Hsp20/alpha crystallin family protein [Sulfolobus sp. S-194]
MSFMYYLEKELQKRSEELSRGFYELVYPPVDMYEEGGYLVVVADLAGFNKEKIKARISGQNELIIEAEREITEPGVKYLTQRPKYVRKVIKLPFNVAKEAEISGKYENGVLTIRIPIAGTSVIKIE